MKTYTISYDGNDARVNRKLPLDVKAMSAREAVLEFYESNFPNKFFRQYDGTILNSEGEEINHGYDDDSIWVNGGYISAEEHYGLYFNGRQVADNYLDACRVLFDFDESNTDFVPDVTLKANGYSIIDDFGREYLYESSPQRFYEALNSLV